ncbi:MAG TPA: hypothetical protein VJ251_23620 [Stellaceae bacterium]|nr:hypothetical protein [Stellaceae bacterium]
MLLVEQRVAEALKSCEHGYMLETRRVMLGIARWWADDRLRRADLGM